MTQRRRSTTSLVLASLAAMGLCAVAAAVFGQVGAAGRMAAGAGAWAGVVQHDPLPAEGPLAAMPARADQLVEPDGAAAALVAAGDRGALPSAIETSQGRVAAPEQGRTGAATYGVGGIEPQSRLQPDRATGADAQLRYTVVFNPSVAPFKRDRVLDVVQSDGSLASSGAGLRVVQAEPGDPEPGRELFWGQVRLSLQPGRPVALPTVAPGGRLLRWQVEPPTELAIRIDRAGNLSATAERTAVVELRYLLDAPTHYFAAPVDPARRPRDPWRPRVPADVQDRAALLWAPLGVRPDAPRAAQLSALVRWFRGFEPGEPPPSGGDVLADLVLSQRGVCRHRSLGFVVVAQSLGIPAQMVINEAHVFVEAWVPFADGTDGWQRIDLGGGADSLQLRNTGGQHLHRTEFRDPWPRPDAYAEGSMRVQGADGLGGGSWAGARRVEGGGGFVGAAGSTNDARGRRTAAGKRRVGSRAGDGASGGAALGDAPQWLQPYLRGPAERPADDPGPAVGGEDGPSAAPPPPSAVSTQPTAARGPDARGEPRSPQTERGAPGPADRGTPSPPREQTALLDVETAPVGYVGEEVALRGRLVSATGGGVPGAAVDVWLVSAPARDRARPLGAVLTGVDGRFDATVALPLALPPGAYELVVRYPGDAKRAATSTLDGGGAGDGAR